jgi:LacI family transcriptional regulator
VREIARKLGYRPSAAARALRGGGYRVMSVVVPDNGWGWWEPAIRGMFEASTALGYQLTVHPVAGTEGGLATVIEGLANLPTEGVIALSVPDQAPVRDACERIGLPGVAIDDASQSIHLPTVSAANRDGARRMVEHLLAQGRRDIALLQGSISIDPAPEDAHFVQERGQGYRDALAGAGIDYDPMLVVGSADALDEQVQGWPELDALLASGRRVDALFCMADLLAAPAIRTLAARRLRVPEEVAVAGFDDERAAVLLNPQLTTMRQPYGDMGRMAVELLSQRIAGEDVALHRHELPTDLIVRASA